MDTLANSIYIYIKKEIFRIKRRILDVKIKILK